MRLLTRSALGVLVAFAFMFAFAQPARLSADTGPPGSVAAMVDYFDIDLHRNLVVEPVVLRSQRAAGNNGEPLGGAAEHYPTWCHSMGVDDDAGGGEAHPPSTGVVTMPMLTDPAPSTGVVTMPMLTDPDLIVDNHEPTGGEEVNARRSASADRDHDRFDHDRPGLRLLE